MHDEQWRLFYENFDLCILAEWLKLLWGHLYQILGNWAGRDLTSALCVNSQLRMQEYREGSKGFMHDRDYLVRVTWKFP